MAAPDMMELLKSSFPLSQANVQSKLEYKPPHTAKLPPRLGALDLTAVIAEEKRIPCDGYYQQIFAITSNFE